MLFLKKPVYLNNCMYIIILLLSLSFNQSNKAEIIEIDLGLNHPTGLFEKYAEPGFSLRISYSKSFNDKGLLKWQFGGQYISFRRDYYQDNFTMDSGIQGPSVDVTNSEQAYMLNGGLRLTATNGINKNGNFIPYIGAMVGLAFFNETSTWIWDDGCSTFLDIIFENYDCDNDDSMYDVLHRYTQPVFTLDIGTNVFFKKTTNIGMDFGIRYNMVTGLKTPEIIFEQENQILSNLSKNLQADYYSWYLGVSIKLDYEKRANKKDEKRRRRQGKLI